MQSKSPRGVQQDDVWGAADALIAEGLRPTIERVRMKIGRGSPNTVSPMLEGWFATLGRRLGVADGQEGGGEVPAPVLKAASTLWELAVLSAREESEKALADLRQAVVADRSALEVREVDLAHRKQVLKERQNAFDEALLLARRQAADLSSRLDESVALRVRRDREIEELRSALTALEKHREAARRESDEEGKKHADERSRLEERAAASERRMLAELDRERQENKRSKAALGEAERKADASQSKWILAKQTLIDGLNESKNELGALRQALASANERATELRGLLEAQVTSSAAARKQLNLRRPTPERKKIAISLTRRRRA